MGARAWKARAEERLALDSLCLDELPLGEDLGGRELLGEELGSGGATQTVVDRAWRDDDRGKAETGVAKTAASGAQKRWL
jgi:hypothetical protein